LSDYKYWITCKADEIAMDTYGVEFDELDIPTQLEVFDKASAAYADAYADWSSHKYEEIKGG